MTGPSTRIAPPRLHADAAQRRVSGQQGGIAKQALRGVRPHHELAAALGKELG